MEVRAFRTSRQNGVFPAGFSLLETKSRGTTSVAILLKVQFNADSLLQKGRKHHGEVVLLSVRVLYSVLEPSGSTSYLPRKKNA